MDKRREGEGLTEATHVSAKRVVELDTVDVADTFFKRLKGLEGKTDADLPLGYGMLFPHCRSLHMHGMKCELDVIWLDDDMRTVSAERMRIGRAYSAPRNAVQALECRAGAIEALGIGPGTLVKAKG